jgi:hypothetical protein
MIHYIQLNRKETSSFSERDRERESEREREGERRKYRCKVTVRK